MLAVLAAEAAALVAAERRHVADRAIGVDPHRAGRERSLTFDSAAHVAGPHAGGEAVARVVGDRDRLLLVLERDDRQHRAEDLLLRDAHVVVDAGEDRRLDEQAASRAFDLGGPCRRAQSWRPRSWPIVDVVEHLLVLRPRGDRADLRVAAIGSPILAVAGDATSFSTN